MQSRITATVLGLAAEIERELISQRTSEALARRKGRMATSLKLDPKATEIRSYLAKGISKQSIAKLVECSPSTLYDWLARRNIRTPRHAA
jgi:DNA invertase Pin-like site-specific DNA recombinase